MIRLSKRLRLAASFLNGVRVLADVGCDHGLLPLFLLERGFIEKAYLMDIKKGPLLRAGKNAEDRGLVNETEMILSDGLKDLPRYLRERPALLLPDAISICGMGGPLILDILSDAPEEIIDGARKIILSPQSEISDFRKGLFDKGFDIRDEGVAEDNGKFYFVMEAVSHRPDLKPYDPAELRYGRACLDRRDATLSRLIKRDREGITELLSNKALPEDRRKELDNELKIIEEAEKRYEVP